MKNIWPPQDQVFWYLKRGSIEPCRQNIETEIAIIGGGMAGLSAAQAFSKRGKQVVLLEQYYCGSGATGKSSGFITPNAELSFTDFSKRYSINTAHQIWKFISSGVEDIRTNIIKHQFACDYAPQDTLVVANTQKALKVLQVEQANLAKLGYKTSFYTIDSIQQYINSKKYVGGVRHEDTFGINAYLYCQEMKQLLQKSGVIIFEETPVTAIHDYTLETLHAKIKADYIIICTDRFMPQLGFLTKDVYHAQTYLLLSQLLTDEEIHAIFPNNSFLVWDTDMIYNYFRITASKRLLLGGGSLLTTYCSKAQHESWLMTRKLTNYFHKKFPEFNTQFEQSWSGLIGISKDIAPIAGRDKNNPHIYYITAAAGLSIAAALGRYSAEHIIDGETTLDSYFSPYRSFPISGALQSIVGTKISFALSNFIKMNIP